MRKIIDAYVVALDTTGDFNIDEKDRPYIASIRSIYLFDHNQQTHCAELTPSRFLIHLYDEVYLTDAGDNLDDDAKCELYEAYEQAASEDEYVHCTDIAAILKAAKPYTVCHIGDVPAAYLEDDIEDEDARHDAEMDRIAEDCNANHPF